jgi:hypothetical protein
MFGESFIPLIGRDLSATRLRHIGADSRSCASVRPITRRVGWHNCTADIPMRAADVPMRAADVPMRAADVPMRAGDIPMRAGDIPVRAGEKCGCFRPLGYSQSVSAILYRYECDTCGRFFEAPQVPDMSYGIFVLRTVESDEAVYLDSFSDPIFDELGALSKNDERLKALCHGTYSPFHELYPITCDKSPSGFRFLFGLKPRCPFCKSRRMKSWRERMPIVRVDLPPVTHHEWDALPEHERARILEGEIRRLVEERSR